MRRLWIDTQQYMKAMIGAGVCCMVVSFGGVQASLAQVCTPSVTATTPSSRFAVNAANGTVLDTKTGLMWKQCSEGQSGAGCATGVATTYTWGGALNQVQAANAANVAGYSDWRLPNIKELHSLVEAQCISPSINTGVFPATANQYWSSSVYHAGDMFAWKLDLSRGHSGTSLKQYHHAIRLVRDAAGATGFTQGTSTAPIGGGGTVALLPTVTAADVGVIESNIGTRNAVFTVTLSAPSATDVQIDYRTSDGTATVAGADYVAASGRLTIPAGATSGTISVVVQGDALYEGNEVFALTLSSPSQVVMARTSAKGTIWNDDGGMNDTGMTTWARLKYTTPPANNLTSPEPLYPNQDADLGRDALARAGTLVKVGGGKAGFDFTKLDATGQPLANQAAVYATTPWDCVQDHVTGLMWEVKTTTPNSLRNQNNLYTWFNSSGINDSGRFGLAAAIPNCGTGGSCDTEKYVAAVNAAGLCGYHDWRLPTVEELQSIVDYSAAPPSIAIDTAYFPNTAGGGYLSNTSSAFDNAQVWAVDFGNLFATAPVPSATAPVLIAQGTGYLVHLSKRWSNTHVRLVRGSW